MKDRSIIIHNQEDGACLPALSAKPEVVLLQAAALSADLQKAAVMGQMRAKLVVLLNATHAPEQVMIAWDMGLCYLYEKKGLEVVKTYLEENKLEDIVAIGRAVVEKFFSEPKAKLLRDQRLYSPQGDDDQYPLSGVIEKILHPEEVVDSAGPDDLLAEQRFPKSFANRFERGDFSSLQDLRAFQECLTELQLLLSLADDLGFSRQNVDPVLNESYSGVKSIMLECVGVGIKILEIGMFCRVFAHLYQSDLPTPLTLPESAMKIFFKQDYRDAGMLDRYQKACQELFPEKSKVAWITLRRYLTGLEDTIQSRTTERPFSAKDHCIYFPLLSIGKKIDLSPAALEKVAAKRAESEERKAMKAPVDISFREMIALKGKDWKDFLEAHRSPTQWRNILSEQVDKMEGSVELVDVLDRIAAKNPQLSGALFLTVLSLDQHAEAGRFKLKHYLTTAGTFTWKKMTTLHSPGCESFYDRLGQRTKQSILRLCLNNRDKSLEVVIESCLPL